MVCAEKLPFDPPPVASLQCVVCERPLSEGDHHECKTKSDDEAVRHHAVRPIHGTCAHLVLV